MRLQRYAFNLLVALDQMANALLAGFPDETISLRAARARDRGRRWGCVLCAILDRIAENHCTKTQASKHVAVLKRGY